jgi:hypothetical protein
MSGTVAVMTDHDVAEMHTIDLTVDQGQRDAVVAEAISVIDDALGHMMQRELMATGEVADILLDLRTLLTAH